MIALAVVDPVRIIIAGACIIGILGLAFAMGLAVASRVFHVHVDPRITAIEGILPGANCGGCSFPGCAGFADALVRGAAGPGDCRPGGAGLGRRVADILGVELTEREREVAVLHCSGTGRPPRFAYRGIADCRAAAGPLVQSGPSACTAGCLGLGTCVAACRFGAIAMAGGLPRVDPAKCTACGACVKICPRRLYTLAPVSRTVVIRCSSHEKGPAVMKVCETGCIGCTKCVKVCKPQAIAMDRFLAVMDAKVCALCGDCIPECPRKTISKLTESSDATRAA